MKAILLALTLFISTTANAAWYAEAHSGNAMGWGQAYSASQARNIAMRNCQARTPRWDVCYITTIYWVN